MAKKKQANSTIQLQDSIGIEQASDIKKQLSDALKTKKPITIDISNLTDIDTSIIQLLLAAKAQADLDQVEFYLTGTIPEEISNLFSMLSINLPTKQMEVKNV